MNTSTEYTETKIMLCYRRHVVGAVVVTKAYVSVGIVLANYLRQGGYVFTLFVCLFVSRIMQKNTQPIFTKFGEKVAHGTRKNPLDFGGSPDHVTYALGLG